MILTQLGIGDFRNIGNLQLHPHPSLNLITGSNGSGKSTILEAIQCLSTGHSFRTRKARELIARDKSAFTLTAQFSDPFSDREHRCGLSRQRDGNVELRLNYQEARSIVEVTRLLPVKALTPDSHRLIQEGPDERRQFLDWGVFHKEQEFFDVWRQFRRSLSQRNQSLRDMAPDREIESWNELFAESAMRIDSFRKNYVTALSHALAIRLAQLDATFPVELHYRSGWSADFELPELLIRNLENHRRFKTTTDGPHRAELAIQTDKVAARQILSRGQQKVLVYLLHLSQLDLLSDAEKPRAVVICDDLVSELDAEHSSRLIQQLISLDGQTFVSGVDLEVLAEHDHQQFQLRGGALEKIV